MTRRVAAAVVAVALVLAVGACGGGDDEDAATPEDVEAALIAREQFTPETADCITGYLYDEFPPEQLELLASEAPSGVPPQLWGRYTQVVLACQYHDELGVPGP